MQDWVFGCDICQDVCPVNRKAQTASQPIPFPAAMPSSTSTSSGLTERMALLDLLKLLEMSDDEFRGRFAGTPVMRAKRTGMQRNACVALGNLGDEGGCACTGARFAAGGAAGARSCGLGAGANRRRGKREHCCWKPPVPKPTSACWRKSCRRGGRPHPSPLPAGQGISYSANAAGQAAAGPGQGRACGCRSGGGAAGSGSALPEWAGSPCRSGASSFPLR